MRHQCDHWAATARGRLALILLLDQFPRHLYRGRAEAFASDRHALTVALTGIDAGLDRRLDTVERVFFYLPLEHAEDLAVQDRCVGAFAALRAQCPAALEARADQFLDFARQHREVIARFGRFPHRNDTLGRVTTAEERAYLDDGGGFGR